MIAAAEDLGQEIGIARACRELGVPRSSLYRARQPRPAPAPRRTPPRALSPEEKAVVQEILNSKRFADCAPRQVYATLLDEDRVYLCHWRTMYRMRAEDAVTPQRRQRSRNRQAKPELRATGPNQVWSWDGRPFGRLVNTSLDVTHRQGWVSSPWRSGESSSSGPVSFQGTRASCEKEIDL